MRVRVAGVRQQMQERVAQQAARGEAEQHLEQAMRGLLCGGRHLRVSE